MSEDGQAKTIRHLCDELNRLDDQVTNGVQELERLMYGWGLELHRDGSTAVERNQLVRASNMATQAVLRLREKQHVIEDYFGDGSEVVQCTRQMVVCEPDDCTCGERSAESCEVHNP